ncbi:hypothetical protein K3495_g10545 [Podosphaera aphanis]|nr:hypothetical protein K3495_g10545 [Podosphaera aphanis]
MENPKCQIPQVIRLLTEGTPSEQKEAIRAFFLRDSSFIHPICRVPSFSLSVPLLGEFNSRWVIWLIYRWYKILSPRIIINIESVEFNVKTSVLYCEITQVFSPVSIPFYKTKVHLTTKITVHQSLNNGKYYIKTQEDLYQSNQIVKFFWPGGGIIVWLFQLFATFLCIIGALVYAPITYWQQKKSEIRNLVNGVKKG